MEIVEELLIKIQEEETAMVISCAKAKAASEKVEATALAKKSETVAEAALKIAAADGRLAQVEEEAKRKEIEIKKRLLEDRLLSFRRGSSRDSFRSRCSITSILQLLPRQESVEKWMQVRDQCVNVNQNVDLKSCVSVPANEIKSLM